MRTDRILAANQLGRWIVWFIITAPALIDWLHGYLAIEHGIAALATVYRLTLLVGGCLALIEKPRNSFLVVLLLYAIFMVIEFAAWSTNSQVHALAELQSFANVFYLPFCYILLSFAVRSLGVTSEYLIEQVITYGKITATIVVLSLIFDIGVQTYSSQSGSVYGFGTQSYYVAGNVLGLTLVVSLAVSIYRFLRDCRLIHFLESLLIFAGAFSVGSRTGIGVSFLLMAAGILYFIFLSSGHGQRRALVAIVFLPLFLYGGFKSYEIVSQYSRMTEKMEMLLAGQIRSAHTGSGWEYISTKGLATRLTGSSYQVYAREFAQYTPKKNVVAATAESDPVDVMAAYGVVGLVVLYLPYALCIAVSGMNYVVTRYPAYAVAFISLSLILGHSLLAGHVLLNSKTTQFACIFFVLALGSTHDSARWRFGRPQLVSA